MTFTNALAGENRDSKLLELLSTGDKRTVAGTDAAVRLLRENPGQIETTIHLMRTEEGAVAMRAADCLEKFSREHSVALNKYASELIAILGSSNQQEIRWHLAQILPRMALTTEQFKLVSAIWSDDVYHHRSSIVRTESLQALYEISQKYPPAQSTAEVAMVFSLDKGTRAMKARARKLLN